MTRTRLVTSVLVAVLAMPLIADVFLDQGSVGVVQGSVLELKQKALEDRVRVRRQQRQYWQAIDIIQDRRAEGEDVTVPDVNDYDGIMRILELDSETEDSSEKMHEAAPQQQASSLMVEELGENDRHLLRKYSKASSCPESLKDYIPGFYELCLSVTKNAVRTPRVGLISENIQLRSMNAAPPATLKLRLQMIQEAYDSTNRREDVAPLRPVNTINN